MTAQYPVLAASVLALAVSSALAQPGERAEFDEFNPIVEINASDGDVGFHVILDGEAWEIAKLYNPDNKQILRARSKKELSEQGVTEVFFESAEPPCWFDDEDPDADPEDVVTVADFIERFAAGTYRAAGRTIEGDQLQARAELTHNLPAAPEVFVDTMGNRVELSWNAGDDLGECEYPDSLPDPAGVEVVRWEVVVEVNEDELPGGELPDGVPFGKFSVHLPTDSTHVVVPPEFIDAYLAAGVNQFKLEVGAMEESGNQTFTEAEFEVGLE